MSLIPFINRTQVWKTGAFPTPWDETRPSILSSITSATGPLAALVLPDEEPSTRGIRFGPGVMDGIFGSAANNSQHIAQEVGAILRKAIAWPTHRNIARLYTALTEHTALSFADDLYSNIACDKKILADRLQLLAQWIAHRAPDREPVKTAIAILGWLDSSDDYDLIQTLGAHEEFSLFAIVALGNSRSGGPKAIMAMAKKLDGWGRIHAVRRLQGADDAAIRHWLVRDGFRNSVMYEYLAHFAATEGDLLGQLAVSNPDDALLNGAADIFSALCMGGPAEDISDYADAPQALALFLGHIRKGSSSLPQLEAVTEVRRYLTIKPNNGTPGTDPWSDSVLEEIQAACEAVLKDPSNLRMVQNGLESLTQSDFLRARTIARRLGHDTWEATWRFHTKVDADQWFHLMQTDDLARIQKVLTLAHDTLPLADLGSGPADSMGIGPEYRDHSALDFIVQELRRFPGTGWVMLDTALRSPVIRNRNMAIAALKEWGQDNWPPEAGPALQKALAIEPDEKVAQGMLAILDQSGSTQVTD